MEGQNPTRRYKWFRPRQSARVSYNTLNNQVVNNAADLSLFNQSSGAQILVVRHFEGDSGNGNPIVSGMVHDRVGVKVADPSSFFPGDGLPPGQVFFLDDPNPITFDFTWRTTNSIPARWYHDFPLAVVPPGWSLVWQGTAAGAGLVISVIYEAVFVDEIDFAFEL